MTIGQHVHYLFNVKFRTTVKDQRLSEGEGLHACGDSYIVVSNYIHWSEKWREFLAFTDS